MTHPCSIKTCEEPVRSTVGEVNLCERHEHMLYDWWRERLQAASAYPCPSCPTAGSHCGQPGYCDLA